ncbi:ABC transporter substrate-binding protein, partial [Alicyclobacillus macrosporangiidus]
MQKVKFIAGALSALMVLAAVGCAPNANEKSANTPPGTSAPTGTSDQTLTIAYSDGGQTLDPAEANDLTSDTLVLATYDQLVTYGTQTVDGRQIAKTDEIKPMLAKSWDVSPDNLTYTFHLREDAKFQDGNPVTADAVQFSLDHVKNSKVGSFLYGLMNIKSVTVKDPHTVEIQLNKPNHLFLQMLAMYTFSILDPSVVKAHGGDYLKDHTAGSGPFQLDKWDPATEADFTANASYWGGAPKLGHVVLKFIPDASNRTMLVSKGGVDMAIEIPPQDVDTLKSNPNLLVRSDPSNRILYFAMNCNVKPFNDPRVRQAIAYAVPYDQLVQDVMHGQANKMTSAVPHNMPGHTDDGYVYSHDLAKAKELLKEAGYPNGFTFTLTLGSGFQDWKDDAVLMQAELKKIGVTMNIQNVARAQFLEMQKQKNLTAFISKWTSFVNDPGYHLGFLLYSKGSADYNNYVGSAERVFLRDSTALGLYAVVWRLGLPPNVTRA